MVYFIFWNFGILEFCWYKKRKNEKVVKNSKFTKPPFWLFVFCKTFLEVYLTLLFNKASNSFLTNF